MTARRIRAFTDSIVNRPALGLDIPLLFDTAEADLGPMLLDPQSPAEALDIGASLPCGLAAFATTGDPGWPRFDLHHRLTRIIDVDWKVTIYPEETSRRLWQNTNFLPLPPLEAGKFVAF